MCFLTAKMLLLFKDLFYLETPEVDLDALLEDLCVMERDIKESSVATLKRKGYNINSDSQRTLDSMGSSSTNMTGSTFSDDERDVHEFRPNSPSYNCLLYTSPSPRDGLLSRMPSSA